MEERNGNGRRATDSIVAKVSAGALIAGIVWSVAAWGVPLVGAPKRLDTIEATLPALLYMSCLNFRDSHPTQLPAVCDQSIGRVR